MNGEEERWRWNFDGHRINRLFRSCRKLRQSADSIIHLHFQHLRIHCLLNINRLPCLFDFNCSLIGLAADLMQQVLCTRNFCVEPR